MSRLKDKVVLITGASAGIGKAAAKQFAEEGAKLILVARRIDRLQELTKSLKTETHLVELDVQNKDSVFSAIENLPDGWKDIDVLVNNAGLGRGLDKIHEGNVDGWEDMINTNIKGLLYVTRAISPHMVKQGSGHIINVGSIAGHEVYPGGNVYCATKHAVDALTRGMRLDLVDTPIRVSTVDPGLVETEFSEVRFYGDKEKAKNVYQGYKPLEPGDVADAIVWIASRPDHVQIAEIIIFPTDQGSAMVTHKR
ncbi:MAG: SDR family NAD(P)-dependent oxidoreductase [Calditrichaeota bacterium]|nr:MAG: SDR family NAD(P)-dependent oxidoreductase [Calditrichota bacterium]